MKGLEDPSPQFICLCVLKIYVFASQLGQQNGQTLAAPPKTSPEPAWWTTPVDSAHREQFKRQTKHEKLLRINNGPDGNASLKQ